VTALLDRRSGLAAALLLALALAIRLRNALRYPPDWGFDASFNWKYILELSRDFSLPHPAAGWAAADPPLFFALSALVWRGCAWLGARDAVLVAVPLLGSAAGLAIAALAVALVRRLEPGEPGRALLAGGLVLFLPAQVQMSAMVNEEIWTALFSSLTLYLLATRGGAGGGAGETRPGAGAGIGRAAAAGLAAGLALLAKLTGAVAVAAAAATYALEGLRRRALRAAALRVAAVLGAALLGGGWYFVRSQLLYGAAQPFGLPAHQRMFRLPPGERGLFDFLSLPLATFTDPQLLNPDLLRSVWGATYATVWFDGHRHFLPAAGEGVRRLGTATLVLALLPTAAFGLGCLRGLRRALRGAGSADPPLLLACAFAFLGYAVYNWKNPWYAVVKGTSLLALCLPFACYASEVLWGWLRGGRARRAAVGTALAGLLLCVTLGTTFGLAFEKREVPGLPWEALAPGGESPR
jgi:hypothetical protein